MPRLRIGIVVTDGYPHEDPDHDTPLLLEALAQRGADATSIVWHDRSVDLSGFDLLVLRSPWDYPDRLDEFVHWLSDAEMLTTVINPPAVVRWNLDKRYLRRLADLGVAVVPTTYVTIASEIASAIEGHAPGLDDRIVVKPAVSAGARDTGLFHRDDPAAVTLAHKILAEGGVAMVQPEVTELSAGHEKALYAFDGELSHAIAKGALLDVGGTLLGGVYQENPVLVDTSAGEREFAQRVLDAVATATENGMPTYARIDVVDSAALGLVLLEVELFEPALNLHVAAHAIEPAASAILRAAARASAISDAN